MHLILLPGLDGHGPFFQKFQVQLPPSIPARALTYPKELARYDALADWVVAALGAQAQEPIFLLGESFGGPLAIKLAGDARLNVRGLILAATFSRPPLPIFLLRLLAKHYAWLVRQRFAAAFVDFFLCNGTDRALASQVLDLMRSHPDETMIARVCEIAATDVSHQLAALPCPVLILKAAKDRIVWRDYPRGVLIRQDASPTARPRSLVRLPTPHMLLESAAKQAAERITAFVQALSA